MEEERKGAWREKGVWEKKGLTGAYKVTEQNRKKGSMREESGSMSKVWKSRKKAKGGNRKNAGKSRNEVSREYLLMIHHEFCRLDQIREEVGRMQEKDKQGE